MFTIINKWYKFHSIEAPDKFFKNKQYIKAYYKNTNQLYELLIRCVKPEYFYNPNSQRSPLIFYLGNIAVFYIRKLIEVKLSQSLNESFENLFATDVIQNENIDTQVKDVWEFRQDVCTKIIKIIDETELNLPINDQSPW